MSDEQQAARDKLANKADEIVELVENNMAMQNAQLTKEEAAEKILLARNYWLSSQIEMSLSFDYNSYSGFYGKFEHSNNNYFYFKKDATSLKMINIEKDKEDNTEYTSYYKQDYANDIYYSYSKNRVGQESFALDTYNETGTFVIIGCDVLNSFGFDVVTLEMILDLETIENGYKFTIFNYRIISDDDLQRNKLILTIQNDRITDFELDEIYMTSEENFEKDEQGNYIQSAEKLFADLALDGSNEIEHLSTTIYKGSYQYENIDTAAIDAKYAEIEAEYLTE